MADFLHFACQFFAYCVADYSGQYRKLVSEILEKEGV